MGTTASTDVSFSTVTAAREFRLDDDAATLLAMVRVTPPAGVADPPEGIWVTAWFPLDQVLGNIHGTFVYGFKNWSKSRSAAEINGTVLTANLQTESGEWLSSSIDLGGKIVGTGSGHLIAQNVPVVVPVTQESQATVLQQLATKLASSPSLKLAALNNGDGTTTFVATETDPTKVFTGYTNQSDDSKQAKIGYFRAGLDIGGAESDTVFKTFDASATAAVFHVADTSGRAITQFSADVLEADAGVSAAGIAAGDTGVPTYFSAGAQVNLVKLKASAFSMNAGLGVKTDIGLTDYSLNGHLLGTGITFGKKMAISVFGFEFGFDFGALFG
ncbi:hypothetical protein B0H63DRAFT_467853 [Podospora didyma]|uniref:Cyanovirin-N domain-containing protein n=1 Tax=Podospora didyma TaxID=330526 RepID=A0AAE0NRR3_9PEZI|nr:hypothetical protein B0H63DRAFT_467853 [Podospora didyma]